MTFRRLRRWVTGSFPTSPGTGCSWQPWGSNVLCLLSQELQSNQCWDFSIMIWRLLNQMTHGSFSGTNKLEIHMWTFHHTKRKVTLFLPYNGTLFLDRRQWKADVFSLCHTVSRNVMLSKRSGYRSLIVWTHSFIKSTVDKNVETESRLVVAYEQQLEENKVTAEQYSTGFWLGGGMFQTWLWCWLHNTNLLSPYCV